ncbi:carbohydrate sulfotransferase 11-like [Mercenaria mercenaria]|uniref:carbohydrate sulfotransferase 11-like n=1 Tax=Mercenaria mercenaria TaxID=6596 RepID=UPI00234F48D4|nr:carbohydrate sulfotransferase 11-like [Mercenaria mercenaria]
MRRQMVKFLCSVGIIIASIYSVLTLRKIRAKYGAFHEELVNGILTETYFTNQIREVQQVTTVHKQESFDTPVGPNPLQNGTDINDMICKRFYERSNILNTACSASKERQTYSDCDEKAVKQNLKYSKKSNIMYCAIEKAGSTFWKRILYVLGEEGSVSNPTHIKTIEAEYSKERFCDMSDNNWEEIEKVLAMSTSIMFVRDPYARLFSAWLDKFYSPNIIYWNSTGQVIAKSQRKVFTGGCICDITFTEFVNHTVDEILSGNKCVDRHFSPNYKHCNPCKLTYDYIGKYETMKEDTLYILNALNLKENVTFTQFDEDAAFDAIKDAADWVFYQRDKISECGLSFTCAMFRVWQRLQSRGVISNSIPFPFLSGKITITRDDFETALRTAHSDSNHDELKCNRKEAMSQALTSLPEHVRQKTIQAFRRDFDLFGYDREPEIEEYVENKYFEKCPPDI